MILAFYAVSNSQDYERHTFDNDEPQQIWEKLNRLKDEEWKFYEIDKHGFDTRMPSASDFVEDYNDEELDGGWWCVLFNL